MKPSSILEKFNVKPRKNAKSDTTRAGFIFADLKFETLFYPVSKKKVLVSERYYVP